MEFGQKVLSETWSMVKEYKTVENHFVEVIEVKEANFMYQRPDTGKVILDMDGRLMYNNDEKVMRITHDTKEYLLSKIEVAYLEKIVEQEREKSVWFEEYEKRKEKVKQLKEQIKNIQQNNEQEYTESRVKSEKELNKALRREEGKVETLTKKMNKHKELITELYLAKEYSKNAANEKLNGLLYV